MIRVFIGYDARETVAAEVAAFSVVRRSSVPVAVTMLRLDQLPMTRPRDPKQSTDFAFSRFLVPWLCDYRGLAVFVDGDVLCRADIARILDIDDRGCVSVVKHVYVPKSERKFLDQPQSRYARKNWSSVMVFCCAACEMLTPKYVNTASGLDLHQFKWCGPHMVGSLDPAWNVLIGEDNQCALKDAKMLHFTQGTPCFPEYAQCEFAGEWRAEREAMLSFDSRPLFSKEMSDESVERSSGRSGGGAGVSEGEGGGTGVAATGSEAAGFGAPSGTGAQGVAAAGLG